MNTRMGRSLAAAISAITLWGLTGTAQAATYQGVECLAQEIHSQTHALGEFAEHRLDGVRFAPTLRGDVRVLCLTADRIIDQAARCGNVNAIAADARALERRVEIMQRHFDLIGREIDCAPPCVQQDYYQARCMFESLASQVCVLESLACQLKDEQRYVVRPGYDRHEVRRAPAAVPGGAFAAGGHGHGGEPPVGFSVQSGGRRGTDFAIRLGGVELRFDN